MINFGKNMGHPFDPSSTSDLSTCDESFIYITINLERCNFVYIII